MYKHEPSGLWVRDERDEWIIKDQHGSYNALTKIPAAQGARILDLGAHIGAFVWFAEKNLNPAVIMSVEPDPRNVKMWRKNHRDITGKRQLLEAAVVPSPTIGKVVHLHLMDNPAGNSLAPFRGREQITIAAVPFSDLMKFKPTLIKCDIEGAEYDLNWAALPKYVKVLCFEFHQKRPEWLDKQRAIDDVLLMQGFQHARKPRDKITFTKNTIGIYWR